MPRKTERRGVAVVTRAEGPLGAAAAAALRGDNAVALYAEAADARPGVTVHRPVDTAKAIGSALDGLVATHGPLRVLVNCPGPALPSTPSADYAADDFQAALIDGVALPFLWAQAAGRRMLATGGGAIVNIVRLSGLGGWPGYAADGAAMAGLVNLTHTLATEWAEGGVRVNVIAMGFLVDQAKAIAAGLGRAEADVVRRVPTGRLADASDIAEAIAYLVDPQSSFVNGEVLRVDGGWDAWGRLHPTGKAS